METLLFKKRSIKGEVMSLISWNFHSYKHTNLKQAKVEVRIQRKNILLVNWCHAI